MSSLHAARPGDSSEGRPDRGASHDRWRHEHEVQGLRDMLQLYRDCVTELAEENVALRDELQRVGSRPVAAVRPRRSRHDCRA
jgi:hypothetical protein